MKLESYLTNFNDKAQSLKKYKNSYILFSTEEQLKKRDENSCIPQSQIIKEISDKWKTLKNIDKEPFKLRSDLEKEKFFSSKDPDISTNPLNIEYKYIKKKSIKKPIKIRTAYNFFIQTNKFLISNNNDQFGNMKAIQHLSEVWNNLMDEHKQIYQDMAEKDKLRFQQENDEYYSLIMSKSYKNASNNIELLPLVEKCNADDSLSQYISELSTQMSKSDKPKR